MRKVIGIIYFPSLLLFDMDIYQLFFQTFCFFFTKCPENVMRSKLLQFPFHCGYQGNGNYELSSEGHSRSIKYVSFDFYRVEIYNKFSDFQYKERMQFK